MIPPQKIEVLVSMYNQRQFENVVFEAEKLLVEDHTSFIIWNILAAAQMGQGKFASAEKSFRKAADLNPHYADAHYNLGIALHEQGKLDDAIAAYANAYSANPNHAAACFNAGNALRGLGQLDKALQVYRLALEIQPNHADACYNMGNILQETGRLEEAVAAYRSVVAIREDYANGFCNLGNALRKLGRIHEAIDAYHRAIALEPNHPEAHGGLGNAFQAQGQHDAAISAYQAAIELKPDLAEAYLGIGNVLVLQSKFDPAIDAYEKAVEIRPSLTEAYINMGGALREQKQLEAAVQSYYRAIEADPSSAEAYNHLGIALAKQERFSAALDAYEMALKIRPRYAEAHNNLGATLTELGRIDEAIAAYSRCLEIQPDLAMAEAVLFHLKNQVCDFSIESLMQEASARLGILTQPVPPFTGLVWLDNPEQQLKRSIAWAKHEFKVSAPAVTRNAKGSSDRIRLGYFGADFHDHATMYLIAGLLREHDVKEFEVFVYSYGQFKSGDLRSRLEREIEHFFDVEDLSDLEIAQLALSHSLDIAVDLKGYTQFGRSGIFQHRPAPVQINFLGYPGSMGSECFDYIIADAVVIPESHREFYTEKIIYLPHAYQPNDDKRTVAAAPTDPAEFGLPEAGVIFCCFNSSYKIRACEFSIWMRLLNRVDDSVLWLFQSNKWAEWNLREQARTRGVDPRRLIFARKLPQAEHIARLSHADIFIDTFNYNAHTTASDALWAGVPVVTKLGRQFSARVAASLLTSVGLPELIARDEKDYEEIIVALARDLDALQSVKTKLRCAKLTAPLFDTKRYTRNFEQGMRHAYCKHHDGRRPEDIVLKD